MHNAQYWVGKFSTGEVKRVHRDDILTYEECVDQIYDYIAQKNVYKIGRASCRERV